MSLRSARNWLGLYFLFTSASIGAFLLLFRGSPLLPLEADQAGAAFQVLVPVLVGQAAVIFKWIASAQEADLSDNRRSPVPSWAIVAPPVLAILIFVLAAIALALSNSPEAILQVSPDEFQSAVTLAVSLLNASTILLIGRIFPTPPADVAGS